MWSVNGGDELGSECKFAFQGNIKKSNIHNLIFACKVEKNEQKRAIQLDLDVYPVKDPVEINIHQEASLAEIKGLLLCTSVLHFDLFVLFVVYLPQVLIIMVNHVPSCSPFRYCSTCHLSDKLGPHCFKWRPMRILWDQSHYWNTGNQTLHLKGGMF